MFADDEHSLASVGENLRAEIAQAAVSQNDDAISSLDRQLSRDLKGGGDRLREDGDIGRHGVGHHMKIALRDGDELCERAIVVENPDHGSMRTVARPPREAGLARPATAIDLADDAAANVGSVLRDPHELVAENAGKSHVTADQLQVGFADARAEYSDQGFSRSRRRHRPVRAERCAVAIQNYRSHVMIVVERRRMR